MEEITELSFEERSRIYTRHKADQMIAAIDELRSGVQRCIESERQWREVAHRSKEDVAREIQNEYSEESMRIRDELRFSIASLLLTMMRVSTKVSSALRISFRHRNYLARKSVSRDIYRRRGYR